MRFGLWLAMKVLIVAAIVAGVVWMQGYCPAERAQFCDSHPVFDADQEYDRRLMEGS